MNKRILALNGTIEHLEAIGCYHLAQVLRKVLRDSFNDVFNSKERLTEELLTEVLMKFRNERTTK